ncbi:hypothetical protein GCM10009854_48770 [Saccharopolyspora halophila]|uniref:VanZ-like domain-containing protein n=1 Tax=Saccharopolyspora halophila TaxID=405551 RepID=A0ABN3GWW5_9PSEU
MITNYLLTYSTLVPIVLVLVGTICVGTGYLVLRSRRCGSGTLWILVVLSAFPIAFTLVPTSTRMDDVTCVVQFAAPTLTRVELLANVAVFFPVVFFVTLATRRRLLMVLVGTSFSAAIEAVQAMVPAIGRACDTNDWAMNTIGTILAVMLANATIALASRVDRKNVGTES